MQKITVGEIVGSDMVLRIAPDERLLSMVLIGQTGHGKTALMEHLIAQDMEDQTTAIIFDPHGELSERILRIGAGIKPENILFCEIGNNLSYGFNPLEVQNPGDALEESQTLDSFMQIFRKHWSSNRAYSFGSLVEYILSHTARTIMENPGYTMAEIPLLLHDKAFRDKLVRNVSNPQVMEFWGWYRQIESTRRPADQWQMIQSTITRLSQFLANEWLYRVLYQAKGTIRFRELIKSGKTIIFSLPIGKLGEEPASLLGSLLLGKLVTTIYSRNEYGKTYPRVHVYIDEYSRFAVPITSALLTQGRKFNVGTTITLQTLAQVPDEENKAAILQTGILIAFQCIGSDAEVVAKQLPLPDPVGLMKPEPILLYSQTPVEDIWHKGHPNKEVMDTRAALYSLVGMLEKEPKQEYFWLEKNKVLAEHPDWRIFTDWDMYRASAAMLKEGIGWLDQYYYDWMQHKYLLTTKITQEEMGMILNITWCVAGVLGIHPVMVPYIPEEHRLYLMGKIQEDTNYLADRFHLIDRWTGEKDYKLRNYESKIEGFPPASMSVSMDPESIPFVKHIAAEMRISPYEIENMIAWKVRELYPMELEALTNYIRVIADAKLIPKEELAHKSGTYSLFMQTWGRRYINDEIVTDMQERLNKYGDVCLERTNWQMEKFFYFVLVWLRYAGATLEKEPVFDTSHSYRDVEYNRRTYSDLRDELVSKIVGLPRFQAITATTNVGVIQFKTPPPLPISPDIELSAWGVREASHKQLGHPWQEVVKDIQTRQNLPPAK